MIPKLRSYVRSFFMDECPPDELIFKIIDFYKYLMYNKNNAFLRYNKPHGLQKRISAGILIIISLYYDYRRRHFCEQP